MNLNFQIRQFSINESLNISGHYSHHANPFFIQFHTFLFSYYSYQKGDGAKPGNLLTNDVLPPHPLIWKCLSLPPCSSISSLSLSSWGLSPRRHGFFSDLFIWVLWCKYWQRGTGFSPGISVFPCQYHSTITPYWNSCICCCYQKDKRAKTGKLPKSNVLSEIVEHWTEKCFHFLSSLKGLLKFRITEVPVDMS